MAIAYPAAEEQERTVTSDSSKQLRPTRNENLISRQLVVPVVLLILASILQFIGIYQWLRCGDFLSHIMYTQHFIAHGSSSTHPLYHVISAAIHFLFPFVKIQTIVRHVMPYLCLLATELLAFAYLSSRKHDHGCHGASGAELRLYALFTILLNLAGPINFLFGNQRFFGYIPINVYHNPTFFLAKPFAIVWFYLCCLVASAEKPNKKLLVATAISTILALCAKPCYVVSLVPALVPFVAFLVLKRRIGTAFAIVCSILIPATLGVGWQYCEAYLNAKTIMNESHIFLSFPGALPLYSGHLLEKLLLSIFFPAVVYLVFWAQARRSLPLTLSWSAMAVACLELYFLNESGRNNHLNFIWGAEVSLYIVFLVSIKFMLDLWQCAKDKGNLAKKVAICFVVLVPHLIGGMCLMLREGDPVKEDALASFSRF